MSRSRCVGRHGSASWERVVRLEPAPRDPEEAAGDKKVAGDEEKVDEMGDDDM